MNAANKMASLPASIKLQKELFVSGHAGTTISEVSAVSSLAPILLLLLRLIERQAWPTPVRLISEHAALILPQTAVLLGMVSPTAVIPLVVALLTVALCGAGCTPASSAAAGTATAAAAASQPSLR